jgi:hypothetical protein
MCPEWNHSQPRLWDAEVHGVHQPGRNMISGCLQLAHDLGKYELHLAFDQFPGFKKNERFGIESVKHPVHIVLGCSVVTEKFQECGAIVPWQPIAQGYWVQSLLILARSQQITKPLHWRNYVQPRFGKASLEVENNLCGPIRIQPPEPIVDGPASRIDFALYGWQKHCRRLYQTPIAT